jgi:hypothetical protein
MKSTRTIRRAAFVAVLALSAIGVAAIPAAAATGRASATAGDDDAPASSDTLYVCDYVTTTTGIAAWEWPGGSNRDGNIVATRAFISVAFDSRPWISSDTLWGQRWIYGAMRIPSGGGGTVDVYGWVGRNYLTDTHCYTTFYFTSNAKKATTSYGERFTSNPSFTSDTYRGQTWVWGKAASASLPGFVGRNWLTKTGCSSGACHYTINQSNIHEWVLPGGSAGP